MCLEEIFIYTPEKWTYTLYPTIYTQNCLLRMQAGSFRFIYILMDFSEID